MKVLIIDQKNNVSEERHDIMAVEVVGRKIRLISYCTTPSRSEFYIERYRYQIMPEYKEK